MSTQLIPFSFEASSIRVITNDDGSWSVVAKDVCDALGYAESTISNIDKTIAHVPDEWKGRYPIPTPGGTQELWCLTEPGLYFFLGRSDKPKALPFQKWIFGDVAPSIRKTGSYALPGTHPTLDPLAAQLAELLKGKVLVEYETLQQLARLPIAISELIKTFAKSPIAALEQQCGRPLIADLLAELAEKQQAPAPVPAHRAARRPVVPDYQRILDTVIREISQKTYPYPYTFRDIQGTPCLIVRTSQVMAHLRDTKRLHSLYNSLDKKSDRLFKRALRQAGLIIRLRLDPIIADARLAHAVAIQMTGLNQPQLALH